MTMNTASTSVTVAVAGTPPGEVLAEKLDELGMTQVEFAERTGLSKKHINKVVRGKAQFSPEVAIRFEQVTGVSARFWLGLQSDWLLARARNGNTAGA